MHVLCLRPIASVALVLGSPAAPPTSAAAETSAATTAAPTAVPTATPPVRTAPLPPPAPLPTHGVAPLRWQSVSPTPASPDAPRTVASPLSSRTATHDPPLAPLDAVRDADTRHSPVVTPLGPGPTLTPEKLDPRKLRAYRIDLLVGPVWRIRPPEVLALANFEAGRLQGFSGTFHTGIIVAPDRDAVSVLDFPIGAGFVYRRRFGERPLYGSVGLTAGILVHRALTERGVIHRVDPDFQLPLKFAWTVGSVGLSVALLQGFSVRPRTYSRRGIELWHRIPYRIGFAIGIHFAIGDRRAKPRRSAGP